MTFSLDQFRLDGEVAVVTGVGSRGNSIDRAMASGLAAAGAHVVAASRTIRGAQAAAEEIVSMGARPMAIAVDIADPASVAMMTRGRRALRWHRHPHQHAARWSTRRSRRRRTSRSRPGTAGDQRHGRAQLRSGHSSEHAEPWRRIVNLLSGGAFPATSLYGVSELALLGLTTTLEPPHAGHR